MEYKARYDLDDLVSKSIDSNVYDQSAGTLALRNWNDYETTVQFKL